MKVYKKDNKFYDNKSIVINGNRIFNPNHDQLIEAGYEVYTPPTIDDNFIKENHYYYKRPIKSYLEKLGLWQAIKSQLTENQYEDMLLSDDFSFRDELFNSLYESIKDNLTVEFETVLKESVKGDY